MSETDTLPRILRFAEVRQRTGLSRRIYSMARDPESDFPKPVRIGSRAIGWLEDEIAEWIENRPRANP